MSNNDVALNDYAIFILKIHLDNESIKNREEYNFNLVS